jgi:hypothetical protein
MPISAMSEQVQEDQLYVGKECVERNIAFDFAIKSSSS